MSEINITNIDTQNNEIDENNDNVYLTDSDDKYLLDKDDNYLTTSDKKENEIMAQKKYVSLDKLTKYDELLKAKIAADDGVVLDSAKDYADSLASNYEAAGAAGTAKSEAIEAAKGETTAQVNALANGQVKTNKEAIEAIKDGSAIDSFADVEAALAGKQVAGDYATKTEAQGYANAKDEAIAAAKAAGDAAKEVADANAEAIDAINNVDTGILAQAKGYTNTEVGKVQTSVDTLAGKVGTVPEGSTVMGIISNIQENAYDDTELSTKIDTVSGKVDTLIGEDANKSVRTIANEELAKQLIAEGADASLDTLTEIAAWIQNHPNDAAAMNAAIEALQAKVDTGDKTVSAYVTDAINALSIGDYAKAADLTALAGRVTALETASATHATKTEVQAVSDSLTEYKDAHTNDYTNAQVDAKIKAVADDVAALNDTYASDEELATAIENEVTRANGAYAAKSLETTVSDHKADTVAHTTSAEKTLWNAALQASDITVGSANGTIAVKGTDVAVKGLGSAAYTEASAYDTAGAAAAVDGKLSTEAQRAKDAEAALGARIDEFVECSETEIAALFA